MAASAKAGDASRASSVSSATAGGGITTGPLREIDPTMKKRVNGEETGKTKRETEGALRGVCRCRRRQASRLTWTRM